MKPRQITLESSAGAGLFIRAMSGHEALARPFQYELELLSETPLKAAQLLGKPMAVKLALPDGVRYFHGIATELASVGMHRRYLRYRATLRPWFWLLTRTSNCRIFQQKTIPEIIKQVFRDHGFSDFEDALSESYPSWEYLVQYRESDFDFVSRLLEQAGIYYFFKHESGRHSLVLADSPGAHKPTPGYEKVPYFPPDHNAFREHDYIDSWEASQSVQSGSFVLDDYDFKRPKAELTVKLTAPREHVKGDYERYSYPGEYVKTDDGQQQVRVRLQELHAHAERVHASGVVRGFVPGALFKLDKFPEPEQNKEYLIVSADYSLRSGELEGQEAADHEEPFRCAITALRSAVPFRPECITPRPSMAGHQTAKVVGRQGEEIWTDEFGRVKVQFPWDREGKSNEQSSCWVRVAQVWAGNNFGSIHIPRIGQEVLVSFLEGDPDRPIITGRVYNGNLKPPYPLPSQAMVSGTKTESTPGGGGYNELSMDDSKGKERVVMHAQRDYEATVENDQSLDVKGKSTETVVGRKQVTLKSDYQRDVTLDIQDRAGKKLTLSAGMSIELRAGAASIELDAAGMINIRGTMIALEAPLVRLAGTANVSIQAPTVAVTGAAAVQVTAPLISETAATAIAMTAPAIKNTGVVLGPPPIPLPV
jgi:type VI secretion system secreted protein VgrG